VSAHGGSCWQLCLSGSAHPWTPADRDFAFEKLNACRVPSVGRHETNAVSSSYEYA
jgi:hypothetical protein